MIDSERRYYHRAGLRAGALFFVLGAGFVMGWMDGFDRGVSNTETRWREYEAARSAAELAEVRHRSDLLTGSYSPSRAELRRLNDADGDAVLTLGFYEKADGGRVTFLQGPDAGMLWSTDP